jgi:hypothetical protein
MLISTNSSGLASVPVGATIFVDAVNGNDSTGTLGQLDKPFQTVFAALAAATTAGGSGVISVGPGLFNEGTNQLVIPSCWSLVGSGVANSAQSVAAFSSSNSAGTIIESTYTGGSATLTPGNYSTLSNFTIWCNVSLPTDVYPIGYVGSASSCPTQVTVQNVQTIGPTDSVIVLGTGSSANVAYWQFRDCNFCSNQDCMGWSGHSGGSFNCSVDIFGCQFNSTALSTDSGPFSGFYTVNHPGTQVYNLYGCAFNIVGLNSPSFAIGVHAQFGTVNLHNCNLLNVSANNGNANSISSSNSGCVVNVGPGCEYNPSLIVTTNGGIIHGSQSQILGTAVPTLTAGPGAGAGSGVTLTLAQSSDDFGGEVTVTTGSVPTTGAAVFSLTFAQAKEASFPVISPMGAHTGGLSGLTSCCVTNSTSLGFVVSNVNSALAASNTYSWNYQT